MKMFLEFWESWPVFITALVTLGVTVYAFLPSQKSPTAGMVYQVITVMSFILALPAVLISSLLGLEAFPSLEPNIEMAILWLNLLGGLVALLSFLLSILGVGKAKASLNTQSFSNVPPGNQYQQSLPSIAQSVQHSAHLTGTRNSLANRATSRTTQEQTDHADSVPASTYQDSTLDDLDSPAYTEAIQTPPSEAPTPRKHFPDAIDDYQPDITILQNPSEEIRPQFFAWLVVLDGKNKGLSYGLNQHRNKIGRANDSHIIIKDKAVSSQHAALLRDDEKQIFMLHDLKSANGTYLHNQRVISPQPLKDKDRIQIGETTLHFMEVRLDQFLSQEELEDQKPKPIKPDETVILVQK